MPLVMIFPPVTASGPLERGLARLGEQVHLKGTVTARSRLARVPVSLEEPACLEASVRPVAAVFLGATACQKVLVRLAAVVSREERSPLRLMSRNRWVYGLSN